MVPASLLMRALRTGLHRFGTSLQRPKSSQSQVRHACTINEENPARYCPGGYHPVRVGDEFHNRKYKIVSKLGYGVYSTVWLACNTQTNQHVALKILTADSFDGKNDTFELDILRHMASKSQEHLNALGPRHVLGLLDNFRHTGPNGQHVCLVFKAMGPDLSKYRRLFLHLRIPVPVAKKISQQLLTALAFLHNTCQVIHCDIKPRNILIETREINEMFEHAPSDVFMPQLPPLDFPKDYYMRSEQVSSADEDLSTSLDISVRLTDFGTSSWLSRHLTEWIQPPRLRAPEVILGAKWDHKVDIWNLGQIIWELVQGQLVFDGQAAATADYSSAAHLAQMISLLGPFPTALLERSRFRDKYFDANGQLASGPSFPPISLEKLNRTSNIAEDEKADFENFIGSMLRLEPLERPNARDLLAARWLKDLS